MKPGVGSSLFGYYMCVWPVVRDKQGGRVLLKVCSY